METNDAATAADYYVYALVRDRRDHRDGGLPFYIGKGRGSRYAKHLRRHVLEAKPSSGKSRVILRHKANGWKVTVELLAGNMTEDEAFAREVTEIAFWGRRDLGTGVLHNLTDGGEGASGRVIGPQELAARTAVLREWRQNATPEQKAAAAAALSAWWANASDHQIEIRLAHLSAAVTSWWENATPEQRTAHAQATSAGQLRWWQTATEEERSKRTAQVLDWHKNATDEQKSAYSDALSRAQKEWWASASEEQKLTRSASSTERISNWWANATPEQREARTEANREAKKDSWLNKSDEKKAAILDALARGRATRASLPKEAREEIGRKIWATRRAKKAARMAEEASVQTDA